MRYLPLLSLVVTLCLTADVHAQTPPIFGGGAALFDPEVDTFNVGAVLDAQVVVSDDRRYVTITARPSISRLQDFATFTVSGTQVGFVGGGATPTGGTGATPGAAAAAKGAAANRGSGKTPAGKAADVPPPAPAGVLGRQGFFQLAALPPARR